MTKLKFRCAKGHTWMATPNSIKSKNSWCRICANEQKKDSIKTFQKIAELKGGVCISKIYVHSKKSLRFQCAKGHIFETTPINIKHNNQWCPICNIESQRSGLDECRSLAKKRGGLCLSSDYKNQHTMMAWRCASGHEWKARYLDIKRNGTWCPICASGIGERICREFFEQLFDCKFPKVRPKWLKNEEGNQMELDGYCKKYNLAFEHHGEHHYSTKLYYTNASILNKRKKDDRIKRKLCDEHGIILLEVPEIPRLLPINDLRDFIYNAIPTQKLSGDIATCLKNFANKEVDYNKAYITKPLDEIRDIAENKGGKLISESYLGIFEKLEFECKEGHRFMLSPTKLIHRDQWCAKCSAKKLKELAIKNRKSIDAIRELAIKKGGSLLSDKSYGAHRKHLWKCKAGHEFEATPANVLMGKWCIECAKKRNMEERRKKYEKRFEKVLFNKEGKIVEGRYEAAKKKLPIQCKNGHVWFAIPDSIIRGRWCPICKSVNQSNKKLQPTAESDC